MPFWRTRGKILGNAPPALIMSVRLSAYPTC
jgi:hypothetical protein